LGDWGEEDGEERARKGLCGEGFEGVDAMGRGMVGCEVEGGVEVEEWRKD